jgi:plastocyanin
MLIRSLALSLIVLAACGGDDGTAKNGPQDAPATSPPGATVMEVACPTTAPAAVVASVDTNLTSYQITPANGMIKAGDIVSFKMSPMHDVAPRAGQPNDPGTVVGFGGSKCLQFTKAGSFTFYCTAHNFNGTLTAQ